VTRRNADFPSATKLVIAKRAAYRCSMPDCDRVTIGPSGDPRGVVGTGVAAHIYGASPGGPRGSGGLSDDQLRQPENGIWLCENDARLIDGNGGRDYSPELLLNYKARHEARIAQEQGGKAALIGWFESLAVRSSPPFANESLLPFGKTTLVIGGNASGKTALCEWIAGMSDIGRLQRWRHTNGWYSDLEVALKFFHPEPRTTAVRIDRNTGDVAVRQDQRRVPFLGPWFSAVYPLDPERPDLYPRDDRDLIATAVGIPGDAVDVLIDDINRNGSGFVNRLSSEKGGTHRLKSDVMGTQPGLSFN